MKKLLTFATAASFLALVACGPSQADLDKAQHLKDSLATDSMNKIAAEQHMKDSLAMDSTNKAAAMQHMKDSLAQDSMMKANKKGGTTKPKVEPKKEPEKAPEGAPKVGKKKPGQ